MRRFPTLALLALPAALLLGACGGGLLDPDDGLPRQSRVTGDRPTDEATRRRLEDEAAALARTDGCGSVEECASIPMGVKGCGGPRYYLPYCPLTTDVPALTRKVAELEAFERAFNVKYGVVSTCDYVSPPPMRFEGAACHFTPGAYGAPPARD
jgi:hypothetical protein